MGATEDCGQDGKETEEENFLRDWVSPGESGWTLPFDLGVFPLVCCGTVFVFALGRSEYRRTVRPG
ncbi:hypothetical protein CSUI_007782 [Cystoisospora suis]|uniref:Transmembrane protein n=1 Tax=Cystoisospora suis TaxID=483139 RepID=A0A2C6KPF2_9APIC|nr:hypothetical protein CSUI_007782 [Cystoisospora suis]